VDLDAELADIRGAVQVQTRHCKVLDD
jgi:hypothetical protein